jgi:hypothetical protein
VTRGNQAGSSAKMWRRFFRVPAERGYPWR